MSADPVYLVFVFEWLTGAQIDGQNISVSRALLWIQGDIVRFDTSRAGLSIGQIGAEWAIVDVPQRLRMFGTRPDPEQLWAFGFALVCLAGD